MPEPSKTPTKLGHAVIDQDHVVFVQLVDSLQRSDDVAFATNFRSLVQHVSEHFEREDALIDRSAFPAMGEHKGEHVRGLGELRQFRERADRGRIAFARAFALERLLPWFELHILTMDSALVAHLDKFLVKSAS